MMRGEPSHDPRTGIPDQALPDRSVASGEGAPRELTAAGAENAGLQILLQIEANARAATSLEEIHFLIANETRKLTRARQIFVFDLETGMRAVAASGLPKIERSTPLVQELEQAISACGAEIGCQDRQLFELSPAGHQSALRTYPFRFACWVPFTTRGGAVMGGMLLTREQAWSSSETTVAERLATTYSHALSLLKAERRPASNWNLKPFLRKKVLIGLLAALPLVLAIPVPMSVLAPFEIVADDPFIVAAPIEGVVEEMLVDPSETVEPGQAIVRFSDTVLRNRFEVTQREFNVAEARLKKATQLAFDDTTGRHELQLAMADLSLKKAELDYARELFGRTVIRAERGGVAVYADKQSLVGKPVVVGEKIMQIADPRKVRIAIDVAVADAMVLSANARITIYLDADPLHSRNAAIEYSDYQAHATPNGSLAFRAVATFDETTRPPPRLGVRGTAQIRGEKTPLAVYLFRRPLSAVRQRIGL